MANQPVPVRDLEAKATIGCVARPLDARLDDESLGALHGQSYRSAVTHRTRLAWTKVYTTYNNIEAMCAKEPRWTLEFAEVPRPA